jgi:Flp pilus assembly protein TadD
MRREAIGTMTSIHTPFTHETASKFALPLSILAGYVLKLFFPAQLNAEYDAPVPDSIAQPHVILGAALLVLIAWCAWRFRHRPAVVLGIGIFLLGIVPVVNVIPIGEVSAERFLYFPSLGFAILFGWVFSSALVNRYTTSGISKGELKMSSAVAGTLVAVFVVALLAYFGRAITRNGDWKNEDVLFAKTAAQSPNLPRPHVNVGNAARRRDDIQSAVRAYKTALQIDPNYPEALNNLAGIYTQQGKLDEAIAMMERALLRWSDNAGLMNNLGYLYYMKENYDAAAGHVDKALELNPGDFRARYTMGLILLEQNNAELARDHFKSASEGGPQFVKAYYHLAVIENDAGNSVLAKQYAQRFLAVYDKADDLQKTAQAIVRGNN